MKLEDLDTIWFCSRKNSKRIIRKLEEEGLLTYQPGRGRGKVSQLQYVTTFQNEIESYLAECAASGKLDNIAEILRLPIPKSWVDNSSKDIRELLGLKRDDSAFKDILHTFKARDIYSLDPLHVSVSLETHLIECLGDTLIRYNSEKDCFDPHIAHHFQVDSTKKIWTFYLRKSVYFHNGETVTSKDVAYTINRMKNSDHSYSWLTENINKVICSHPHKVEIQLFQPNPFFLRYLSAINFCILPADIEFDEFKWVATGPFRLKERKNQKIVLEANDSYFKERPLIDEIHFYRVTNDAAKTVYLSSEEKGENLQPNNHKIKDSGLRFLSFNMKRSSIVQKHTFREAIYHLFDVKKMAAELAWEVLESNSFEIENAEPQQKHPEKIIDLIKESGYKGEMLLLYHFDNYHAVIEAEWFKKEAKQYGIIIQLQQITFDQFSKEGMEDDIDLIIMGLTLSYDKHLAFSYAFRNKALLFNRLFNRTIETFIHENLTQFELEEEKDKRMKIMEEIEQYLKAEIALIYLYHPIVTRALDPTIQDVTSHSFGHIDFTKLWIPS